MYTINNYKIMVATTNAWNNDYLLIYVTDITYTLHNLQGHLAGTHVLIFTLNRFSVWQFLISVGICSQILVAKYMIRCQDHTW